MQVPGTWQQVLHLRIELPGSAIGQQLGLALQAGLWSTGPQGGQVQRLPLALGLHHRLFLPGLDLRLQGQMDLVLCAPQSVLPGCGGQLGLHRELGLRARQLALHRGLHLQLEGRCAAAGRSLHLTLGRDVQGHGRCALQTRLQCVAALRQRERVDIQAVFLSVIGVLGPNIGQLYRRAALPAQ